MANAQDNRKSEDAVVGTDKAPKVVPEIYADTNVNGVAVKGDEKTADNGSVEDKLASAVKAEGVDLVQVWAGQELYYVEMERFGTKRLLSVTEAQVKDGLKDAAKDVVAEAGYSNEQRKEQEEARKESPQTV